MFKWKTTATATDTATILCKKSINYLLPEIAQGLTSVLEIN